MMSSTSASQNAVFILPEKSLNSDGHIIKLKHPKDGQSCMTYLNLETKSLNEIMRLKEKHVSWFVDNSVLGDTQLSIGTPLDPLFMIIPYLVQNVNKFSPLAQILVDEEYPSVMFLEELVSEEELSRIADVKPSLDKIVKYSKVKTLDWLSNKVSKVAEAMRKSNISPGFNSSLSDGEYTRYACGIVSDYISSTLLVDLQDKLGIEIVNYEDEKPAKKPKLSSDKDDVAQKPVKNTVPKGKEKAQKLTKGQKQLASVNTKGMKSMSSFFKKVEK